jgi:hypothetical protein
MKKALLIGIDYIDVSGISLKGCINDVISIRNMLIDAYDYEPQNIIMLRDDDTGKFQTPTHDIIYDSIVGCVIESATLDEFWLHYSGHGSRLQNQNSSDSTEILIPVDYNTAGGISDKELYDMVRRLRCRSILTFDCCHSGTVCDLPYTIDGNGMTTKISNAIVKNPYIFMISGCRDDQISMDSVNEMDQHTGAFTNALCECLRNSHHNTSILSLHKDICIYLTERGYSQSPVLSSTVESPKHIFTKGCDIISLPYTPKEGLNISSFDTSENMHRYIKKIDDTELRGLLPIISSYNNDSISTDSSITRSLTSLCRHFYKNPKHHSKDYPKFS